MEGESTLAGEPASRDQWVAFLQVSFTLHKETPQAGYSRPAWTRSCAACCRWPCFGRRVGL